MDTTLGAYIKKHGCLDEQVARDVEVPEALDRARREELAGLVL